MPQKAENGLILKKNLAMKRLPIILCLLCLFLTPNFVFASNWNDSSSQSKDRLIFVYGNGMDKAFIRYVAELTEKKKPTICFVTTAAADNPMVIKLLEQRIEGLSIKPRFLITFISSSPEQESFEEMIMSSDAVMVGGGNTLNMLGIWRAQGIDKILGKAYEKGIILAGGSAGSLCWFDGGYSDSRPKELSIISCLGFLPFSHSCHHNTGKRRELYHEAILNGDLGAGYACDDGAVYYL